MRDGPHAWSRQPGPLRREHGSALKARVVALLEQGDRCVETGARRRKLARKGALKRPLFPRMGGAPCAVLDEVQRALSTSAPTSPALHRRRGTHPSAGRGAIVLSERIAGYSNDKRCVLRFARTFWSCVAARASSHISTALRRKASCSYRLARAVIPS